jgi:RNA 3'-terminal phosphate cyclase (ATP)
MKQPLTIDGSQGEGGGQILRSSLALALVTGRPVRIENIRAGREKPGLMRQHLTAVRAATEVGAAEVTGDHVGSTSIEFTPSGINPGAHHFAVGTAGSATLVLQTVLPALMIAESASQLVLEGGTHNPWAPPYDFLAKAFFPLVNRMGPRVSAELERHGFYPAGGGKFTVSIEPARELTGFDLLERGEIVRRSAVALIANLNRRIAEVEVEAVAERLNWPPASCRVDDTIDSAGPGNVILVEIESDHVHEVFTGFGRVGASAAKVASEVVDDVREYLASGVPVGHYLADQLVLPLGIAAWQTGRGGSFRTLPLTRHTSTHVDLVRRFLEIPISVEPEEHVWVVRVGG